MRRAIRLQCSSPVFAMQAFGDVRLKLGAYYTQELAFSPSTAMKSRPVYYTRVLIIHKILR